MVGGADSATAVYGNPQLSRPSLLQLFQLLSFAALYRRTCPLLSPTITGTHRVLPNDLILLATTETAACTTTVLDPDHDHARLAVYAPPRTVLLDSCFNNQGITFISFN